jgi:hypothetical protein
MGYGIPDTEDEWLAHLPSYVGTHAPHARTAHFDVDLTGYAACSFKQPPTPGRDLERSLLKRIMK